MPSPEEYEETPRDEDEVSEHDEGSQQTNLFAAMTQSSWCPLWVVGAHNLCERSLSNKENLNKLICQTCL